MPNKIHTENSARRMARSKRAYRQFVDRMRNTKKSIKLVRKRVGTTIWRMSRRSVVPSTPESSSCGVSSEVTAKEVAEAKEWTREGGIPIVKKKVDRLRQYWTAKKRGLRGMTEGWSTFIFRTESGRSGRNEKMLD
ncbi:hypothetical protein SNEBB_004874 [Seison nebaliae]|nr:hypothetical protein SNEBB_004874 [Seison nebaliae]